MLSLARDLLKKSQRHKDGGDLRPLTLTFWSDFMANPSIMYDLFSSTPRKLNYDPDRVKVMGTSEGMINQLNVRTIEDLDSIRDELIGMPVLLRVWLELVQNTYTGAEEVRWEGDMALLVDTSHPMIRPEVEAGLEEARRVLQDGGKFCLQIDFAPSLDMWLRRAYPRGCCTLGSLRHHRASLFITNYDKPETCFRCNALWFFLLAPCWLFSAPCYKTYRCCKCKDITIQPIASVNRRVILPSGKIVEATR